MILRSYDIAKKNHIVCSKMSKINSELIGQVKKIVFAVAILASLSVQYSELTTFIIYNIIK